MHEVYSTDDRIVRPDRYGWISVHGSGVRVPGLLFGHLGALRQHPTIGSRIDMYLCHSSFMWLNLKERYITV
ncbi:hypothetical protein [Dyella japonica]|uniref:Uncharacterized protein n=1 Tax=Dyella japonica TaxID=231455 RepID=A0ABV2K1A2_9GAMM